MKNGIFIQEESLKHDDTESFFLWGGRGVGIKLIKAIHEKVKKKGTKFFGRISEGGIPVIAKKLE